MDTGAPSQTPPILAVDTSTAGFVGATAGGTGGEAVFVTSFAEFEQTFGTGGGELAQGVRLFFLNGGTRAYVVHAESHVVAALSALVDLPVSLLSLPDTGGLGAAAAARRVGAAAEVCERQRRFLFIDPPASLSPAAVEAWARDLGSLPNAAVYIPRLRLADGTETAASGAVAGLAARTDRDRGVWSAPAGANGRVQGVIDVAVQLSDEAVDHLTTAGINPIRNVQSSITIWGARTLSVDVPKWKYVSVRRLALFIERSIAEGTQWAAFEPNDEVLWSRVQQAVDAFMLGLFRQRAFQGTQPEEAYFVRCDRTTMTQDDIDNGRLVVLVGFAPVVPAEFMTIRIA
jgi:uncharacterized protein